jgi:hypothetical protein
MWDSSQHGVYFNGFRNHGGARPSIPLIAGGPCFVALIYSFTECRGAIP